MQGGKKYPKELIAQTEPKIGVPFFLTLHHPDPPTISIRALSVLDIFERSLRISFVVVRTDVVGGGEVGADPVALPVGPAVVRVGEESFPRLRAVYNLRKTYA